MENQISKHDFLKILASSFSPDNNFKSLLDDYPEIATNLICAHNICVHDTNMKDLDERHQNAIHTLWCVIEAIINEGIKADDKSRANK